MNSRSIPFLPLGVLAILAGLTFWLSQYVQTGAARASADSRHEPDTIIENFSAKKLSLAGDIEYAVNAKKMVHFQDDDSSVLDDVEFIATQPGQPRLVATAPKGELIRHNDGSDEVVMSGGVRIDSVAHDKYPALRLTTPKLYLYPDKNLARSRDGVQLTSPTGTLNAQRFELDSSTRNIVFERAKAIYQRIP